MEDCYILRKILEEEGFQKYADEEKGDFTFLEAEETLNLNFYNMYSSVFTTILIPMLGVKGSVASPENSLTDFNEFVFIRTTIVEAYPV